jgi:deoxycytidine triphosphate deaminase
MIIGTDIAKELGLIENLCDRELENPEGAGFDIRIGEIFKMKNAGFLGVENRKTPDIELIASHGKHKEYFLKPEEYVIIKTIEKLNLPENIVALTFPRSTLQRCGVLLLATQSAPGYKGELIFGLKNLGEENFRLELGTRIAHIIFFEVKGKTTKYKGQWQDGRVTTGKEERQT